MHLSALKTGWHPTANWFPLFSIPCCPDGVKLLGLFSGHLASSSFVTLLSRGPPHCIAWISEHKAQVKEKKVINRSVVWLWEHYRIQGQAWGYCDQGQILALYCEDADFRDMQGTSHKSFLLSSHWLLGPGKLNPWIWPYFKGNLRTMHLHNPRVVKTLVWICWSRNQCLQEMLEALRRTIWATLCKKPTNKTNQPTKPNKPTNQTKQQQPNQNQTKTTTKPKSIEKLLGADWCQGLSIQLNRVYFRSLSSSYDLI